MEVDLTQAGPEDASKLHEEFFQILLASTPVSKHSAIASCVIEHLIMMCGEPLFYLTCLSHFLIGLIKIRMDNNEAGKDREDF